MAKEKTIQLSGMLTLSFDERENAFVQFTPDDPDSVEIEGLLLEGSAQLQRCGQFDFISNKCNKLIINDL